MQRRPRRPRRPPDGAEDPRSQALTEWRHLDVRPLEKAWRTPARTVGDFLPDVLKDLRLEQRLAESHIIQVWDRAIDPVVAAHARPVGLHNGTLFVNVDSNVWLSELVRYRRHELLELIRHAVGGDQVQRISFRL